jgi:hypothetical protein
MKTLVRSGLAIFGVFATLVCVGACGGDDSTNPVTCVANQSQACAGPMGCAGFQVCAPDGKSFSACNCGGGTGGSGTGGGSTSISTGGTGQGGMTTSTGQGGMTTSTGQGGQGGTGQGGMTSSTGTGMNPVDCEPMEPQSGSGCNTNVTGCVYGDQHCECWPVQGNQEWDCDTCPAQEPTGGDPCMTGGGTTRCFYGATTCACPGGGGTTTWSCNTCPAQEPMDNDACTEIGIHCVYPTQSCSCFGFMGMGQWTCF